MEKRYFTAKEVAVYLGLSEYTIRAWVQLRQIPFSKLGRAVRFDIQQLGPWLKKRECRIIDEDFHLQR